MLSQMSHVTAGGDDWLDNTQAFKDLTQATAQRDASQATSMSQRMATKRWR